MSKLTSEQIDYIDRLNASIGRTATLLRAAAGASDRRDAETLMFVALETIERGECDMKAHLEVESTTSGRTK